MPMKFNGDSGLIFPDNSAQSSAAYLPFRNRIINGDMRIDQRNNGAQFSDSGNSPYTVDRWRAITRTGGTYTLGQQAITNIGSGLSFCLLTSVASAKATASTDQFRFTQGIEGLNCADLEWGRASAKPVAVSFWVYSSIAGLHSGAVFNDAFTRSYVFTYTVNSANTWEYKTVIIPGDTTGTWLTTTAAGIWLSFDWGSGSSFTTSTTGAWQAAGMLRATGSAAHANITGAALRITGVQFEPLLSLSSTATPFERVDYSEMLRRCLRYTQLISGTFTGLANNATAGEISVPLLAPMRTAPTMTNISNGTYVDGAGAAAVTGASLANGSANGSNRVNVTSTGMTQSRVINVVGQSMLFTSEL